MIAEGKPSIIAALAAYLEGLCYEELPPAVVEQAKTVLCHNLIVALGARNLSVPGQDRVAWPDGAPRAATATRLTDGLRGPNEASVYTNSLLMGARAQHDEHPGSVSHFGSCVIPPLLAVAENRSLDGRAFLVAMVAGYQVGAAIGRSSVAATTRRGFRPTGLYGPFAGAGAVAKACGGGPTQIANALAIAASSSAGITQMWQRGTDEWRYQTAAAAKNGFNAAMLAEGGALGAPDALEGTAGFYRAFADVECTDRDMILGGLRNWAISEVILKPFPVCAINQAAVQRVLELRRTHGFTAGDVVDIAVRVAPSDRSYPGVDSPGCPSTPTAAMMSMQFSLGVALVHGSVDVSHLAEHADPAVLRAAAKVRFETGPEQALDTRPARRADHRAAVQIRLLDGRCISSGPARAVEYDRGGVLDLARDLLPASGLSWEAMEALTKFVFTMEDHADAAQLLTLCNLSRLGEGTAAPLQGSLS
ncbi:MmgE/PrpD family protein [Pseudarthrobacter enclensis]|uniref:2-methylcitrate dehydratase PrpD n=1 Tax=Pseudarthrobacter enclensis TaxID=993070 RepID=A0ABT9RXM6_9MICC|nr:MmgE/PrpD family protein [Pseudarthrobacter enclensis]MDP9889996.1 2-methylcitrate dehydratase PrpD [Pseudarthrobacter enclensis]